MVDTITEQKALQPVPLDTVMQKIERHCGYESEEGADPVNLFKDVTTPDRSNPDRQAQYAANMVYDGMMYTLNEIAAYAVEKAKGSGRLAKEYEEVARAIEPLTGVCRALADDQVPLSRNIPFEQMLAEEGDTAFSYRARDVEVSGSRFREIRVFIRPRRFERSIQLRRERLGARISETAQARMSIEAIPADTSQSRVHIRTDREDALNDYQITYDIEIGGRDSNLMDRLDFSKSGANQVSTGQRETHHFSSSLTAEEFGVTFADILEASNNKFAAKADASLPSLT